jgi:hypothetical protein
MPAGYTPVRVHHDHDTGTWYATLSGRESTPPRPLAATDRESAQTEAAGLLTRAGLSLVSAWTYGGDDEAGAHAVFAEAGSGDATKAGLLAFWKAHRVLLAKLSVDVAALPAGQRALLFSQDVMLIGLAKTLVDKGVLSDDDLTAAVGAVGAADFSWLTGL